MNEKRLSAKDLCPRAGYCAIASPTGPTAFPWHPRLLEERVRMID